MTTDSDRIARTYAERLTILESKLETPLEDRALQRELESALRSLLVDHRNAEAEVRSLLLDRFESGRLREPTLRLVQGMLDRIVTEDLDTAAGLGGSGGFTQTDVIPTDAFQAGAAADRVQVGSLLRDRFLLQNRVAGGSMGVVYKALDRRLAEVDGARPYVAIKVLSPQLAKNAQALRALQQEASKGRCLSHPNIVRFIDLDREDDLYFIVMEWIEGRSLAAILDDPRSRDLDVAAALRIVRQVGAALDYAHRCGVVHADVKPGNIMITPDGDVKLIDFGVARVQQKQRSAGKPEDAEILRAATPAYSSMQVLTGEDPVPADDVFSLGCLMYRLVAGYRVFGPRNAAEAAEAGMAPERLDSLNDDQWRVLKKALSYSRVTRYGSPRALIEDLNAASGSRPVAPRPDDEETITGTALDRRRRVRWPVFIASLALLGGAGVAVLRPDLARPWLDRAATLAGFDTATRAPVADSGSTRPAEVADVAAPPASDSGAGADIVEATSETAADTGSGTVTPIAPEAPAAEPDDAPPDSGTVTPITPEAPVAEPDDASVDVATPAVPAGDAPENTAPGPAPTVAGPGAPAATHVLALDTDPAALTTLRLSLREDGDPARIDLVRSPPAGGEFVVAVDEVSHTGNRSPLDDAEYELDEGSRIRFEAGQTRARLTLRMTRDPLREPDRDVELVLRDADDPSTALGRIALTLEDDDQRAFEASLLPNTVAFATSQAAAEESETAVQIDVIRFKPDAQELEVRYVVEDVTATEGEDYFAPGIPTIYFAPNQRTARLLIPLVQDSAREPDEAFFIELADDTPGADADTFRRIAVMIRDDDS